ncbi:MAG: hypothetical protein GY909_07105 [Oligoflexia bacterium]|nr:hypothetical protein [Oligoflexia bacterium]
MKKLSIKTFTIITLSLAMNFIHADSLNDGLKRGSFAKIDGSGDPNVTQPFGYSNLVQLCEGELPTNEKLEDNIGAKNFDSVFGSSIQKLKLSIWDVDGKVTKRDFPSVLESDAQAFLAVPGTGGNSNQTTPTSQTQRDIDRVMRARLGSVCAPAGGTRLSIESCTQTLKDMRDQMGLSATDYPDSVLANTVNQVLPSIPESGAAPTAAQQLQSDLRVISENRAGLKLEQKQAIAKEYGRRLKVCNALFKTLSAEPFQDDDARSSEDVESSSGAMMACVNSPNPQQCMMQSAGSKVTCKNKGVETQDFVQCKKITNWLEGFTIAKQGLQMTQQVRVLDNQMDMQADLLAKQRETGTVGTKDALEVQKEGVEQQANMANERAVFDGAKAAILAGMINDMPTKKKLYESCNSAITQDERNMTASNILATPSSGDGLDDTAREAIHKAFDDGVKEIEDSCQYVIYDGKTSLVMNQKARSKFKLAAFKAGTDAAANIAKGAILNDQADQIGDAINDIEEYTPPEFNPWANYEDAKASECIANPDADGCIQAQEQYSDFYGGNLRLNGDRGINSEGVNVGGTENSDGDSDAFAGGDTNRGLIPNSFGDILPEGSQSNEFEGPAVAAGTMKKSSGGGAGGGGGGKAGAVSAPGKAPNTGGGPGGRKSQVGKGVKVKFGGTGGGSLAFRSGRGLATAGKKRANGNPLSNLFGKKGKGKKGNTMDFGRGPASGIGSKKGSIFKMISNRYDAVHKDKRLKEYKLAP